MTTLVGLVPGERGLAAVHLGALLARSFGGDLVVASVVPTPWPPNPYRPDAEYLAAQEQSARAAHDRARAAIGATTPAEYVVHQARSVSTGLLELAERTGAHRVALGSSGTGPFGVVSLGSIADRVLHGSRATLSVAPAGFTATADAQVERLTVGFGRSDGDGILLGATAAAADVAKAALRIACFAVRPMNSLGGTVEEDAEDLVVEEWAKDLGDEISKAMLTSGLAPIAAQVESVVGQGTSWTEALADLDWVPNDVIVVGASTSPFSRFLLGSHASKIVRSSPVPVLVVPRSSQ